MSDGQTLAARLNGELKHAGISLDQLSARTKVPRSTLRLLCGEDVIAIAPGRVYLRGHWKLVARELGIDLEEALTLFDARFPEVEEVREVVQLPRGRTSTLAIAAGLAGVGLLAVILSIFG